MTGKRVSKEELQKAIGKESKKFEECYLWIEKHMPPSFFEEVDPENILLIAHSLIDFHLQEFVCHIRLKDAAIAICLDSPDADLKILNHYRKYGIKNFRTFVSNEAPPFPGAQSPLRIATIFFTAFVEKRETSEGFFTPEKQKEIFELLCARNSDITESEFHKLLLELSPRMLRSLTKERLVMALDMFQRAKTRDTCQYEIKKNEEWKGTDIPSLQIVFAWRNVPKYNFLHQMAKVIQRHKLTMKKAVASYINPYSGQNILLMSLGLHGANGKAAWEVADIDDFLKELATLKYFVGMEAIESTFVDTGLLTGNFGNLVKSIVSFVHQALVHADVNMYAFNQIEEGICRHPELIVKLCQAFELKFHPHKSKLEQYRKVRDEFMNLVEHLDTGQELNDTRRKNILKQAMNFVEYGLKTNYYRNNKTAFSFRLDPAYLDRLPYEHKDKFPELPYAIFFMKGMHYISFHIRFKDLSRGGLRTVLPERMEQLLVERNNIFAECYNLAYTQQKKNKDIPEGGAKGVILLEPYDRVKSEEEIYQQELADAGIDPKEIESRVASFRKEHKLEYLYQSQRSYVESFLTLVNCEPDGKLRAKDIVDYWQKPEYIYLGPDENMHNVMIEWISSYSTQQAYKPGNAFMSSKPGAGINHKEYGVTSLGVNVYMEEVLKFLRINPAKDPFTIKISGGPDGDVAGNQIMNLYKYYPKTAKLLALIDVSGTINDPNGLDLEEMAKLFKESKPIRFYPPEKLSEGGFLLDAKTKREQTAYTQQTLLLRKVKGKIVEEWLSGNEMNHILRHNLHQTKCDIFIPGGGRPRTLNENNWKDYLDETGKPTSRAIVEGANLYLTPWARRALEKLGVIIIKDSSANKGGVITSSFEVLSSLCLSEEEFLNEKAVLVPEILEIIRSKARDEAALMLRTHQQSGAFLTDISDLISERINTYTYELLDHFQTQALSNDPKDPLIRCLLNYCPPLLRIKYQKRVLLEIPDIHKKAVIACYLGSRLVYQRGLDWTPNIVDSLPLIVRDENIVGSS